MASNDESEMVRAASAFALQKFGENYLSRLVDFMDSDKMAPQVQAYLFELGTPAAAGLVPRLLEPDEGIRRHVAEVLGGIGDQSTVAGLTPLLKDRDKSVQKAAKLAIERIKTRSSDRGVLSTARRSASRSVRRDRAAMGRVDAPLGFHTHVDADSAAPGEIGGGQPPVFNPQGAACQVPPVLLQRDSQRARQVAGAAAQFPGLE